MLLLLLPTNWLSAIFSQCKLDLPTLRKELSDSNRVFVMTQKLKFLTGITMNDQLLRA